MTDIPLDTGEGLPPFGAMSLRTYWTRLCEARCRKTGVQCPHKCRSQIPNSIAGRVPMDSHHFWIEGRPVHLCDSHYRSFRLRAKRLLALPLIEGGHLSPYNSHGYGSVVIRQDRVEFDNQPLIRIPERWGVIGWRWRVPLRYANLPKYLQGDHSTGGTLAASSRPVDSVRDIDQAIGSDQPG